MINFFCGTSYRAISAHRTHQECFPISLSSLLLHYYIILYQYTYYIIPLYYTIHYHYTSQCDALSRCRIKQALVAKGLNSTFQNFDILIVALFSSLPMELHFALNNKLIKHFYFLLFRTISQLPLHNIML